MHQRDHRKIDGGGQSQGHPDIRKRYAQLNDSHKAQAQRIRNTATRALAQG